MDYSFQSPANHIDIIPISGYVWPGKHYMIFFFFCDLNNLGCLKKKNEHNYTAEK